MYGTQAVVGNIAPRVMFENDVKMYGTQASFPPFYTTAVFENDVKMYGTQAYIFFFLSVLCLRMM